MLRISHQISIPDKEIEISAIRSRGAGGQNVNKVSTAIHLRFNILTSSLPQLYKQLLKNFPDNRITNEGIIVIKSQRFRSQDKNKEDALLRLKDLIRKAMHTPKKRKATKPTRSSQKKRVESKIKHGRQKVLRGKVVE